MKETDKTPFCLLPLKVNQKMWVLEDYPSSEEKMIMNLEALSLESLFIKTPSLLPSTQEDLYDRSLGLCSEPACPK